MGWTCHRDPVNLGRYRVRDINLQKIEATERPVVCESKGRVWDVEGSQLARSQRRAALHSRRRYSTMGHKPSEKVMPQIPIFLATLVALTAVLLLGPQWGVVLGLASFAASDTLLLRRELRALRRQLDQMQAELPLQVYEQVTQRIDKVERILDAPKPTSVESVVTTPQAPSALPETATRDGAATETASGVAGRSSGV